MPRGYVKLKGRKKEAVLLIQGRLRRIDLTQKSADPWHKRLLDQLKQDRVADGLYRISLSSFQGGRPTVKFNPKKMDPKKFADQIEKKDRKGHATTGSPGISGYQRATDASSAAAHNRSREAVELVKWLKEDYNEPPEIKKRLGGRYGGEPKKAIANPGNMEPAMSATNEAVANAKDDVTPEDSHEIEADLAEQPELGFVTHSQKMFEEMDDILGEDGPVGNVQKKLMRVLHGAGHGDHQLSDLAKDPAFWRVHFGLIQRAALALKKKMLITYDGVSKVSLLEKGIKEVAVGEKVTIPKGIGYNVNGANFHRSNGKVNGIVTAIKGQEVYVKLQKGQVAKIRKDLLEYTVVTDPVIEITNYKGWPIYSMPTYTTPYFYPQQRYVKGKKVGGPAENYPKIKKVEKLIDKWLKQIGLTSLNESESGLSAFDKIRVRSKVTIVDRFGKKRTGKAVIHNRQYDSWALNMGGRHGTPAIATRKNVVAVKESVMNEFQARPSGAKGIGSRASSATMAAGNKKINPVPVPENHNNLDEAGPPDISRPRGNDGYIIRIIQTAGSPEKALRFFDRASGSGGRKGIISSHAAARMRRYPKDFATVIHKEEFGDFRDSKVSGVVNDEPLKIKDMAPEKLSEREADTFPVELLKTKIHNIKFSIRDMIKYLSKVESSLNEMGNEIRSIINTEGRRDRDLRKGQPSKLGEPSQPSVWSRESEQKTVSARVAYNNLDKALKELKKEVGA